MSHLALLYLSLHVARSLCQAQDSTASDQVEVRPQRPHASPPDLALTQRLSREDFMRKTRIPTESNLGLFLLQCRQGAGATIRSAMLLLIAALLAAISSSIALRIVAPAPCRHCSKKRPRLDSVGIRVLRIKSSLDSR